MAHEYASLATLRAYTRKTSDTTDDPLLTQALSASVQSIDDTTGRRFDLEDTPSERVFDPKEFTYVDNGLIRPATRLLIDDIGVFPGEDPNGVTVIADGVDITSRVKPWPPNAITKERAIEALTLVGEDWRRFKEVKITAQWGWPSVPPSVVQANLIQASRLYRRKDSPEGAAGVSEWGVIRVPAMDPDVRNLIKYYIKAALA